MSSFQDLGGELIANVNQMAAKTGIFVKDGLSLTDGGKGLTAGYIKCALCNVKSMKKYAFGRGFSAHLQHIHKISANEEAHDEAVKLSLPSLSAPGLNKKGEKQADYKECLPRVCAAAKAGDATKLQQLLDFDSDIVREEQDKFGANALDWAAGEGHLECVALLLPIFHPTISEPSLENVLKAEKNREIQKDGEKKRVRRRDGKSCLHWACRNGHSSVVAHLVDNLYSVDALYMLGTGDGTTPLHVACFGGKVDMLHFLFDHYCTGEDHISNDPARGTLFTHTNNWGCYPEHFACMSARSGPSLFDFFVDRVYAGDKSRAAKAFFLQINAEKMTPIHKWLLYFCKEGRDVHSSLKYLADLRSYVVLSESSTTAIDAEEARVPSLPVSKNGICLIKSHYATLQLVDENTDFEGVPINECIKEGDIKRAYRDLSRKYHPDRFDHTIFVTQAESRDADVVEGPGGAIMRKMEDVNEAYAVLGDPEARKAYDDELHNQDAAVGGATGDIPSIPSDVAELIEDRLRRYDHLTSEERNQIKTLMNL